MAAAVQIKRTANATAPSTVDLASSELAYSNDSANDGANAILYIEAIDSDNGPVIHKLGGKYYTTMLDLATHFANVNTIVKRDSLGRAQIAAVIGNLFGHANTATSATFATTTTSSNITTIANSAVISNTANAWTTSRTLTLFGDATGNVTIDGSSNVTMNVIVLGGNGNSGNANVAQFAVLAGRSNSTTIANTANIALFATNAGNANVALFAQNSDTANTAGQASFATLATTAQQASFSTLAATANVALFAANTSNANTALSSAYSTLSEKANSAVIANNANNAINATVSVFATNASNANISLTSGFATLSHSANVSNNANNAINATVAAYSTLSEKSNSTVIANNANNAINANFAITATSSDISNTANTWTTSRTITLSGDASGNVGFNGSANVTLNVDVSFADLAGSSNTSLYANLSEKANSAVISNNANNSINAQVSTYSTLAETSNSSVISNTANTWTTARTIRVMGDAVGNVTIDGSGNANLVIVVTNTTNSVSVADTANALTTPRVITLTGDASGNVVFDGTANVNIPVSILTSDYAETSNIANVSSYATLAEKSNSTVIANLSNSAVISNNANNSINAQVAVYATLAEKSNSTVIANLSNSAVISNNANNSINAQVAVYSTLSEKANSAVISNNANNSINATISLTSTYATLSEKSNSTVIANDANNAINAIVSLTTTYATLAEKSNSTVIANLSNSSVIANNANNSINAQVAVYSTSAETANVAVFAENANTSVYAETANTSLFANVANVAFLATEATHAVDADFATAADTASFAIVATSCNVSDSANNAINATYSVTSVFANSASISNTANAWTVPMKLTLSGETAGSVEFNGSSNVTLQTTIDFANVTVALGTNTSGDYVRNVLSGTGITITGQGGEGANVTASLNNTAVSPSTYGGVSAIPVFVVDAQGRLTSASNVALSTDLTVTGNVGSDTVNGGEVLSVVGGKGITTSVASNTVSVINSGVTTLTGTQNQIQVSGSSGDITLSLAPNITASGNLTVLGQLNVLGNITTTNFATITAEDSMIKLANNNSLSDALDIGIYGEYNSGGVKFAGLVRDASDGVWKLFKDTSTEPDNTINFSTVSKATLDANLTGGNVSGLFKAITVSDGGTGNTTFAANAVLMGNAQNPIEGVTGTEGQMLKWTGGKPTFATVSEIPAGVDFLVGTANASVPSARVIEAGNNITIDKTVANKIIVKREAFTGQVTSPANSNVLTISSNTVTDLNTVYMPPRSFKYNPFPTANTPSNFALTGTGKVLGLDADGNINLISFSSVFSMTGNAIGLVNGSILNGTVDPTTEGSDNDLYYNKTNVTLFGPKISGVWPTGINLKGKPGWNYLFGPSTGNNDPGTGKIRFDTANVQTATTMRVNATDNDSVARGNFIASIVTNGTIDVGSLSATGTTNFRLRVTGNVVPISGGVYYNIPVSWIAGASLPGDQEPLAILYTPGPNVQWDSSAKVLRDISGTEISNPLTYATTNDVPTQINANTFTNKAAVVQNGGFPYAVYSDGNVINILGVERLDSYSPVSVAKYIHPNSGLTWTISNVAGKVRLTTSGAVAHGLSSANAVVTTANVTPVSIRVVSGTGWTGNSFHEITAVTSTTIDLATNHTGQGAPTVAGANTEVEVLNKTLPKLGTMSVVSIKFGVGSSGVTSSRRTKVYLDNSLITEQNQTNANVYTPFESGFMNQGITNLQKGLHGKNATGSGSGTIEPVITNVETKNGNTTLRVAFLVASADVVFEMQNYFLYVKGAA